MEDVGESVGEECSGVQEDEGDSMKSEEEEEEGNGEEGNGEEGNGEEEEVGGGVGGECSGGVGMMSGEDCATEGGEEEGKTEESDKKSELEKMLQAEVDDDKSSTEVAEGETDSDRESDGVASSTCTVATTTSYLHGDKTTVQRLVARGLRQKQHQYQRKTRPKKEGRVGRSSGAKQSMKQDLQQWTLDSGW